MILSLLTRVADSSSELRGAVALTDGPAAVAALLKPSDVDPRTRCPGVVAGAATLLSALLRASAGEEMCMPFILKGIDPGARQPLLDSLRGLCGLEEEPGGGPAAQARFGATLSPLIIGSGTLGRCARDAAVCFEQLSMFANPGLMAMLTAH